MSNSVNEKLNHRVLPVSKSAGVSTYDIIRTFKRMFHIRKIGHAGTLDPPATGLVLLLTGEATKLSNYLMDLPKRYLADIKLGESTDTHDSNGKPVKTSAWEHITREDIVEILPGFLGKRMQTPPMFSALKHKGTPLYVLARRGQEVVREPREVEAYEIKLIDCDLPIFRIEVFCSRGLYLRVLAVEMGEVLGVPSHLHALTRINVGHFGLESAISDVEFDTLVSMDEPGYSLSDALQHLPAVTLSADQVRGLMHGIAPRLEQKSTDKLGVEDEPVRLLNPHGELAAIGEIGATGMIQIKRVMNVNGDGVGRTVRGEP